MKKNYFAGLFDWRIGGLPTYPLDVAPGFNHTGAEIDFRIESAPTASFAEYNQWMAMTTRAWEDRSRCSYCGAEWHPSRFHPGSCGECGGPR